MSGLIEKGAELMTEPDLVRTGVRGLDEIFQGGIPRSSVILVAGVAGSGKTILGTEFIYRGITESDEPGITLNISRSELTRLWMSDPNQKRAE
jgi:KaiC/GvpD/RAD55 family RecA-like ATPase